MTTIKFIATTKSKLQDLPIVSGQLIFVTDEQIIYLDTEIRTAFKQIITVPTEQFRQEMVSPVESFYFVNETKILWQYEQNIWYQLTDSPKENIVFIKENDFPETGEIETLYVTDDNIFRWNNTTHQYTKLSGASETTEWQNL